MRRLKSSGPSGSGRWWCFRSSHSRGRVFSSVHPSPRIVSGPPLRGVSPPLRRHSPPAAVGNERRPGLLLRSFFTVPCQFVLPCIELTGPSAPHGQLVQTVIAVRQQPLPQRHISHHADTKPPKDQQPTPRAETFKPNVPRLRISKSLTPQFQHCHDRNVESPRITGRPSKSSLPCSGCRGNRTGRRSRLDR